MVFLLAGSLLDKQMVIQERLSMDSQLNIMATHNNR